MKSPLIIGVSALALLTLSATLFAQTTTGSSLITQMKAATHAFTLAGDLNPGTTGLESSPLVGKRTGDMLSAGEYNRLLEIVGQGGGGKFEINDSTKKTDYSMVYPELGAYNAAKWIGGTNTVCGDPIPDGCREIITAQHDFCHVTAIAGNGPHVLLNYNGNKKYRIVTARYANQSTHIGVTCYDNIGTGGSGGGASGPKILKGTATVGFTNGQPHSSMATVSFGSTCTNPVITVQSVNDSIACGTGAGPGTCSNSPGTTSEDLKAYFSGVTATDFKVYLSSMSGVWVGASSPAFGINYIVACD